MDTNIYHLELIFILLNIILLQRLVRKDILTELLFLKRKSKKHYKKKSDVNLLRTNPNKGNYDVFYTIARIKTFISEIENKKLKELEGEINKNKRKNNYKRW